MSTSSKDAAWPVLEGGWCSESHPVIVPWTVKKKRILTDHWCIQVKIVKEEVDFLPENVSLVELAAARDNLAFDSAGWAELLSYPSIMFGPCLVEQLREFHSFCLWHHPLNHLSRLYHWSIHLFIFPAASSWGFRSCVTCPVLVQINACRVR